MTTKQFLITVSLAVVLGAAVVLWLMVGRKLVRSDSFVPLPEVLGARPESPEMPSERPFVGVEGDDPDGYPLRTADRNALIHMLRLGMFEELERYLAGYQADFEADPKKEYWPLDAFDSFRNDDPSLELPLDEWVETRPSSWAAWMARGSYRAGLGWFYRGGALANETSLSRFQAMRRSFAEARADLAKALELEPKLVAAHRQLIIMGIGASDDQLTKSALDAALAVCPTCLQVRVSYIFGLRPIWGGSFEEMTRFAAASQEYADRNPRLRVLLGYPALERCRLAMNDRAYDEAAKHCGSLTDHGHWEFDWRMGQLLTIEKKFAEAIELLDRAQSRRPQNLDVLEWRSRALRGLGRWEEMGAATLSMRRQNVTDPGVAKYAEHTIEVLLWAAGEEAKEKRFEAGYRLVNLALSIHPDHQQAKQTLSWLDSFQASMTPKPSMEIGEDREAAIAGLRRAVAENPGSFDACVALDRALVPYRRFDEIAEVWTDYLERHPDDGRALLERGGTHTHRRDADAALSDMDAACRLGLQEGCSVAAKLRRRLGR